MGRDGATEPVAVARARIAAFGDGGANPRGEADAAQCAALAEDLANVAAQHVYGEAPASWLARMDEDSLVTWARGAPTLPAVLLAELFHGAPALGRSDVGLMPRAAARSAAGIRVARAARNAGFRTRAELGGAPETGALARVHDHALAALHARWGNACRCG
jgi:hypothetical protein